MNPQVCIIGAGPAGMGCALKLASLRIPSVIFEKEKMPREKICGDGLSGRTIEALNRIDPALTRELDLHPGAQPSWGVKFVSPGGKEVDISYREDHSGNPSGYIMRRRDFDDLLARHCKKEPLINFQENFEVTGAVRTRESWLLEGKETLSKHEFPLIVLATGNKSAQLLSSFNPNQTAPKKQPGLAVRTYFQGVSGIGEDFPIELHFYKELLPWYFWIFPLPGGVVNTGLGMLYQDAMASDLSLKQLFHHLIESKPGLRERFHGAEQIDRIKADRIDYFRERKVIAGDGYLVLGDAAQLIDPFTGEGIGNALFSGIRAAETIKTCLRNGDFSAQHTRLYEEAIYRTMQPELELGLKLQSRAQQAWLINLVVNKTRRSKSAREGLKKIIDDANNMNDLNNPLYYLKVILNL